MVLLYSSCSRSCDGVRDSIIASGEAPYIAGSVRELQRRWFAARAVLLINPPPEQLVLRRIASRYMLPVAVEFRERSLPTGGAGGCLLPTASLESMPGTVNQVLAEPPLSRFAAFVGRTVQGGMVSELVRTVCCSWPPLPSVNAAARKVGCDRRRLCEEWRAVLGRPSGLRVKDFVDASLLVYALHRRTMLRSWYQVGQDMNTDVRSLTRVARKLTCSTLGDARTVDRRFARLNRFVLRVLADAAISSAEGPDKSELALRTRQIYTSG